MVTGTDRPNTGFGNVFVSCSTATVPAEKTNDTCYTISNLS